MHADAELGSEVPDAGVGVRAVVEDVVGRPAKGRVLVVRPDEAAPALGPRDDLAVTGASEVPLEQDGGDGNSGEGSADGVWGGADPGGSAVAALEFWGIGLPEGEELDTVFEVAVQDSRANIGGEDLAGASAEHEELIVAAVVGDTKAALCEDAQRQRPGGSGEGCWYGWFGLCVEDGGREEKGESQCAGLRDAANCFVHSLAPAEDRF